MADYTPDPIAQALNMQGLQQMTMDNPYLTYSHVKLPWPSSYYGTPNDAMGNPIAAPAQPQPQPAAPTQPQGTTLNNSGGYRATNKYNMPDNDMQLDAILDPNGFGSTPYAKNQMQQLYNQNGGQGTAPADYGTWQQQGGQQQGGQQQQAASSSSPANDWQTTLSMLGNPGKYPVVGANVPQANIADHPSVLGAFLDQHGKGGGAFFDTLNKLRST